MGCFVLFSLSCVIKSVRKTISTCSSTSNLHPSATLWVNDYNSQCSQATSVSIMLSPTPFPIYVK